MGKGGDTDIQSITNTCNYIQKKGDDKRKKKRGNKTKRIKKAESNKREWRPKKRQIGQ